MVEYQFDDKVAFVTGAARGQGRLHAVKYAENGADVVVTDIDEDALEETVDLVEDRQQEALAVKMDVTGEREIESAVSQAIETFGRIDVLVNNAGVWGLAPAVEIEESEWDKVVDVNLKGPWLCAKHVAQRMIEQGDGGRIINISSSAGLVGWKNSAHYAASKHGVIGLTKTLALELAEDDITVNAICPGSIDTDMPKAGLKSAIEEQGEEAIPDYKGIHGSLNLFDTEGVQPLDPEEVSNACLWLSSEDAAYITGIVIPVDGGFMAK